MFTAKQASSLQIGYLPAKGVAIHVTRGNYVNCKKASIYGVYANSLKGEIRELMLEGPVNILYDCQI